MKNYAKIGNREGKPAYRIPSRIAHQNIAQRNKSAQRTWDLAKRLEYRRIKNKKLTKKSS
jgi:hypothetical protein